MKLIYRISAILRADLFAYTLILRYYTQTLPLCTTKEKTKREKKSKNTILFRNRHEDHE